MGESMKTAIVISASSDIGAAMCSRWATYGWNLLGTYRQRSEATENLSKAGMALFPCDLGENPSVEKTCAELATRCGRWDVLVLAAGTQDPVGPFEETPFDSWEKSVKANFTSQLRVVHCLLSSRNTESELGPCVLFFAGGGTNNAVVNYSAYTISKIALTKMCELLDAEIPDTRFSIVGPGWVKTKIHEATLTSGRRAGANYQRTMDKLSSGECTPIETVLDSCDWVISQPRAVVSGRNFSTVHDQWGSAELAGMLARNPDMYKLRRYGNDFLTK